MNLAKSFEFFDPGMCKDKVHIIGCGSVGSTVAELLARFGIENVALYDFDVVEAHNLANQMFTEENIGKAKAESVYERWIQINPEAKNKIEIYPEGWNGQRLAGYVFLCVDNIDLRRKIVEANKYNDNIKAMFDFRTSLDTAQHYAADWSKDDDIKTFLETMDFTHEEAEQNTPMSACHVSLCVAPTVWSVAQNGVVNFVNFVKTKTLERAVISRPFAFDNIVV